MTSRNSFVWIGAALVLAMPSMMLAQGYPGAGAYPGMPGAAPQPQVQSEVTKPLDLTDGQVKGFFAAMKELQALGEEGDAKAGIDRSSPHNFVNSLSVSQQGMAILTKNGFTDVTQFQRVGFNMAMAHNVVEQGGKAAVDGKLKEAEAEQAKALAQLKQQVSPEQYEMMKQHIGNAMGAAKILQDVPEVNVELMKKYGDEMENLGKD